MTLHWIPADEQLARYVRDDCSSEESLAIQGWLVSSPDNARRLEAVRRLVTSPTASQWNVAAMWEKVRAETVDANRPAAQSAAHRRVPRVAFAVPRWRRIIAASILVGLVGTGGWFAQMQRIPNRVPAEPEVVYQTTRGQTAMVQLSDGSRVRLAPESRLTIAGTFGDSLRELALEGEAEFDVHHDAARPFRVRTATTITEDIGTRFGIRAYRGEPRVTVAVAEGAVALARRSASMAGRQRPEGVLLSAGDLGTLDRQGTVAIIQGAAVSRALAWTKNELIFAKQPLSEVLNTIARWYDLDIVVADAGVASRPVTAEFSTQSPDEMIQALAIAVDAVVERDGRHVTLKGR